MPDTKSLPDPEVPPSPSSRPPPVNRHWTETIPSAFAVIISAISLWIAMNRRSREPKCASANRHLDSASNSCPSQQQENDSYPQELVSG
jgi:hypothetical protein